MKEIKYIPLKLKKIFYNNIIQSVLISLTMMVVFIILVSLLLWSNRKPIINFLIKEYKNEQQVIIPPKIPIIISDKSEKPNVSSKKQKKVPTVIDAVKKAQPAVVSIIVKKEVPKYDISYKKTNITDQNGNSLPNSFLQTPIYTPNGTEIKKIESGSGFLVSSNGLIVTNRHVVSTPGAIFTVLLNNGKKYSAKILDLDPVLDIALMKINGSKLPYLTLADSNNLDIGQTVIAIGNALGQFENTVSVGVVSGLSRSIEAGDNTGQVESLDKVIQTDAAINRGNSGGPLLNIEGNVVGINVALVLGSSNIGFSLPINSVKEAIDSVMKTGRIIRPYVGIRYVIITPALKAKENLPYNYGIWIQKGSGANEPGVIPFSPAQKAGLKEGDIILSVDGKKVSSDYDFSRFIHNKKIGDFIMLEVYSKGTIKTRVVVLEQAPNNYD